MSYGIGIHGSTNNAESVPGRASEGCVRLRDNDLRDLRRNFAFVGMKVVIKDEMADDLPFETKAFRKQRIERKRHFDPRLTLTDSQIARAQTEQGRGTRHFAEATRAEREAKIAKNVRTAKSIDRDVWKKISRRKHTRRHNASGATPIERSNDMN